ncbi:MAG: ComF family protein [Bacteroidota bacterium]|nr:ComF family protein [Bacteroidota bacterium]
MKKVQLLNSFVSFFYPKLCAACKVVLNKNEENICLNCLATLPKTNFHLLPDNPIKKIFWGRIPIESATSFLYFVKQSRVQELLHNLKYRGQKQIGSQLGYLFGNDLKQINFFKTVDFIIPVPLHPRKLKKRGYNQSEYIAYGLSQSLGIKLSTDNLIRDQFSSTQTKKSKYLRWENVKNIFQVIDTKLFENKHILLIDDVITTGSTIEACFLALNKCENIKFSVATIAYSSV